MFVQQILRSYHQFYLEYTIRLCPSRISSVRCSWAEFGTHLPSCLDMDRQRTRRLTVKKLTNCELERFCFWNGIRGWILIWEIFLFQRPTTKYSHTKYILYTRILDESLVKQRRIWSSQRRHSLAQERKTKRDDEKRKIYISWCKSKRDISSKHTWGVHTKFIVTPAYYNKKCDDCVNDKIKIFTKFLNKIKSSDFDAQF